MSFGVQGELVHISSGMWIEFGGLVDDKAQFGAMASIGWSIFGIEAQVRGYKEVLADPTTNDGYGFSLVGKIRVPLGFIFYVLSRK